jgi:hypothetical protein
MGQVWTGLQNTFKKHIPEEYLNRAIDTIFDSLSNASVTEAPPAAGENPDPPVQPAAGENPDPAVQPAAGDSKADEPKRKTVSYEQLHEAIAQVFNKINEIPGANWAPPSKEQVDEMLKESDIDQNEEIDREEFRQFVRKFSKHLEATYAREMLIVTVAVPIAATLTKMAGQRVPIVGGLISKVPNTVVYASASAAAMFIRNKFFISNNPGPTS